MKAHWLVAAALVGALATRWLLDPGARAPAPAVKTERTVVVRQAPRPELRWSDEALADRAAPPAVPEPAGDPAADPAVGPEPTPDQDAAAQVATATLDDALRAGRWTDADNLRFSAALAEMEPSARDRVVGAWAASVNAQRLALIAPPRF